MCNKPTFRFYCSSLKSQTKETYTTKQSIFLKLLKKYSRITLDFFAAALLLHYYNMSVYQRQSFK